MAETNADALRLAEAARLLAERDYGEGHTPPALLLEAALVYSNLAIAEGQERVAEALEGQVEGRYRQALVEIAGAAECQGEPNDNKVRERCFHIADDALKGGQG